MRARPGRSEFSRSDRKAKSGTHRSRSQRFFATLVEKASDIVLVLDPGGVITYVNPAGEKVMGQNSSELVGRKVFDFILPQDVQKAVAALGKRAEPSGVGSPTEIGIKDFQGSERYFETSGINLLDDPEIKGIIVIARDITDRKRIEDALGRSEAKLQTIFDSLAEGVTVIDLSGKIVQANSAVARLHGFNTSQEMLGRNAFEFVTPGERRRARKRFQITLSRGHSGNVEYDLLHRNGTQFPAVVTAALLKNPAGEPEGFIVVTRNITEQKQAEAALKESEAMYRALFECRFDSVVVLDESMHLLLANKTTASMFGFRSVDEIMKLKNIIGFIPAAERARVVTKIKEIFSEDKVLWGNEYKVQKKSGEEIWIESAPASIEFQGKKAGIVYLRDITERRKSEAQVTAYQKELRSLASQMVLSGERERRRIAREVHDHLTQTLAICKIKLDALAASQKDEVNLKPIREISSLIKQLVDESRSLAFQISSPLLYEFGLGAALERLLEDTQKQHGFACHFENPDEIPSLADEVSVLLFQAVRELLINVTKHAGAHNLWLSLKIRANELELNVKDDGVGFDVARISDPHAARGFGLFSIRELLRDMGGRLTIESKPGQGTSVMITAPLRMSK